MTSGHDATVRDVDLDARLEVDLARTLAEIPRERLEILTATVARNPRSTIEPERLRTDALGRAALAELGDAGAARDVGASVVVEGVLGEGGMGVVRLATQRSLSRKVAVKTLRPDVKRDDAAVLRLLREAWVTGSLEHPNIVPVYELGLDATGAPVIVMRRIEGDAWSELLGKEDAVRARFGNVDLLEHDLRILVQLCRAVSLAHARGIIHRDLKPENVMIGGFGEVYLVDWGVALALAHDPTGRLPSGSNDDMAGTPVYMAPEMLGTGAPLSERTDVYLLGAVLHEILTGRPPHDAPTFRAIIASILSSSPSFPESAPRELVAIARQAMSADAAARFASVDELRTRLEDYLRHRGSLALSAEAGLRLDELRALADAEPSPSTRERIHRLFAEARFGFRQALAASADNEAARDGLRASIESVVAWELTHGTAAAAATALAELEHPPADVVERVRAARAVQAAREARLTALERDLDPDVGRRTRAFVAIVLGVMWTLLPILLWTYEARTGATDPRNYHRGTFAMMALAFALVFWARESLQKSLVNRRVIATGSLMFGLQLALQTVSVMLGLPAPALHALHFLAWFAAACSLAIFVDPRMWPTAAGYFVSLFVTAVRPELAWALAAASNAVLVVNASLAWRRAGDLAAAAARVRGRRDPP